MTNRQRFTLFLRHDDPELQTFLDMEKNVILHLGGEILELKQRKSSLGTYWVLKFIGEDKEVYGRYQSADCRDIEQFLKIVKDHLTA